MEQTWQSHTQAYHIINNLSKTNEPFNLRFIHHRLPTRRIKFSHDHRCPRYHDLFIQCPKTSTDKKMTQLKLQEFGKMIFQILYVNQWLLVLSSYPWNNCYNWNYMFIIIIRYYIFQLIFIIYVIIIIMTICQLQ